MKINPSVKLTHKYMYTCTIIKHIPLLTINPCLQSNRLYYDPENSTYYSYDYDTRQYVIHSQVELPVKEYDPSDDVCVLETDKPLTMEERVIEDEKPTQLDLMFENGEISLSLSQRGVIIIIIIIVLLFFD